MEKLSNILDLSKLTTPGKPTGLAEISPGVFSCGKHGPEHVEGFGPRHWCNKCLEEQERDRLQKLQTEHELSRIRAAHDALDLPQRFRNCTLANYRVENQGQTEALKACKDFVSQFPRVGGLVMLGGVGTGKTHLAAATCKALCDLGHSCHITTVARLVRRIKNTWNFNRKAQPGKYDGDWLEPETEEQVIREYIRYELLVIDEIGSQYGTNTERIVISEIIDRRYNEARSTIIIGNVRLSEAEAQLGKRAIDRIRDQGRFLLFDWPSLRKPLGL